MIQSSLKCKCFFCNYPVASSVPLYEIKYFLESKSHVSSPLCLSLNRHLKKCEDFRCEDFIYTLGKFEG